MHQTRILTEWAPIGAAHFLELVADGFYEESALFRSVKGYLGQFGITDKSHLRHWHARTIPDDAHLGLEIKKYQLSYAAGGENHRSTQVFIAYDNIHLGSSPWETPFAEVVRGRDVVDSFNTEYGEISSFAGNGPDQARVYMEGNSYLEEDFPNLDYILSCQIDGYEAPVEL